MPPRLRVFYSCFALILLFSAAVPLYRELSRPTDIWWTPQTMRVPLAESSDRVEIYVRGKPLAALLQAGQVGIARDGGWDALAASDVGLRLNNWDRVRARRLPLLLAYAVACGVAALLFLLALTGRLAYRVERGAGSA